MIGAGIALAKGIVDNTSRNGPRAVVMGDCLGVRFITKTIPARNVHYGLDGENDSRYSSYWGAF